MQEDKRPREHAEKMVSEYLDGTRSLGAPFSKHQAIEDALANVEGRALSESNTELIKFWQNVQKELEQMKAKV